MRIFNLNSNLLLQNWMRARFYKAQMTKECSLIHNDEGTLWGKLKKATEEYSELKKTRQEFLDNSVQMNQNKIINNKLTPSLDEIKKKIEKLTNRDGLGIPISVIG